MRLHYLFLAFALTLNLFAQQTFTVDSHTTESLRGISLLKHGIAWASGTHGTYLRSADGGHTWSPAQVPGADALDFRDVEAFGATDAYLLAAGPGDASRIYKTTDGGMHWVRQFTNSNPKGFFDCMAFWDENHGIAVGDPVLDAQGQLKFELIATDDGTHWNPLPSARLPVALANEGAFAASGTCIATQGKKNVWFATGGAAARVFHSSDRGQTWTVSETPITHGPDSAGIFSIAFRDARHGVIVGGDYKQPMQGTANLAYTSDGGRTWQLSSIAPQFYMSVVAFTLKKGLFAAGTSHAAYISDSAASSWTHVWDFNLNALAVDSKGNAIAVGPKGLIVGITRTKSVK
jgi:photosystem II stability/assembly factor-like uncharacterized protein